MTVRVRCLHRRRCCSTWSTWRGVPLAAIVAFVVYAVGMPALTSRPGARAGRPAALAAPAGAPAEDPRRTPIPRCCSTSTARRWPTPTTRSASPTDSCRELLAARRRRRPAVVHRPRRRSSAAPLGVGRRDRDGRGDCGRRRGRGRLRLVHLLAVGVSAAAVRGGRHRAARRRLGRAPGQEHPDGLPELLRAGALPRLRVSRPGCARRHRDVRPGRFGIVRRRCQCGTLDEHPAAVRLGADERLLPALRHVAGAPAGQGAGDRAAVLRRGRRGQDPAAVQPWSRSCGCGLEAAAAGCSSAEFGDAATSRKLEHADRWLQPGHRHGQDAGRAAPRAYIIRLITKGDQRILHLFDAAGELFYTAERTQELRYLEPGADVHPGHRPAVGRGLLGSAAARPAGRAEAGPVGCPLA